MSVVNKMLQDLEARENEAANVSADYQPSAKRSVSLPVILFAVVALIAAGIFWFKDTLLGNQNNSPVVIKKVETIPANSPAPVAQTNSLQENETAETNPLPNEDSSSEQKPEEEQQPFVSDVPETEVEIIEEENLTAEQVDIARNEVNEEPEKLSQISEPATVEQANEVAFEVTSSQPEQTSGSLRDMVQYALKNGDNEQAIQLLYQIVEQSPENIGARKKLSAMLFAQGQVTEAKVLLREGVGLSPQNLQLRLMLARLLYQENNFSEAFETLESSQASAFLYPDFVSFRASLAEKIKRYDVARSDYRQLLESEPEESRWWLGYAVSLERLEENSGALQAYQRVANLGQLPQDVMQFVQQRIRFLAGTQ